MSNLADSVKSGRVEGLVALRDRLASEIDAGPAARDLAALALRLSDVLSQLEELGAETAAGRTPLDELARRRSARESAS